MTFYAHLNVLCAIILGLAAVKLLQGIVWMIHGRQRIKVYWVHVVWIVNAILGVFLHYWHMGYLRSNTGGESWRGFADMLLTPIFIYLVAGLFIPARSGEDRPVDLRDFYYENHAWIFGGWAIVAVVNAGFLGAIVTQPLALDNLPRYLLALGLGALAVIRNKWFHMVMAIVMLLGILSGVPFVIFN